MRVAWLAILLGVAMELLLFATGFGAFPGLGPVAADLVRQLSWSTFVCVGLALGTAASGTRASLMGLMGLLAAPRLQRLPRPHARDRRDDTELAAKLESGYGTVSRSLVDMRFSEYFERFRKLRSDRADITISMCEGTKTEPMKTEAQDKGRTAYWSHVPEKSRYLKVIVESDGEEITTAHWDRGFKREVERRRKEG